MDDPRLRGDFSGATLAIVLVLGFVGRVTVKMARVLVMIVRVVVIGVTVFVRVRRSIGVFVFVPVFAVVGVNVG